MSTMTQSKMNLLIVDDDEGDRKLLLRSIKRSGLGWKCTEAETMERALQLLEKDRFNCVILDYHLPGANGLDGISEMLRLDSFLPIIMSTGQGSERIASEAIKLGAMDYISKEDLNAAPLRSALLSAVKQAELKRKLAEQQTALAIFARVLVHDMKAPTQSILGFAKLIEVFLQKEDVDREKIIQQAQRVGEGALRMNALLDQLHAYTEADTQPQFENWDLNALVADVIVNLDATISARRARVVYSGLPVICGDRTQLTQLLQNLIGNGIKYCQADIPEVRISSRSESNGRTLIEVRDNGIGIPEKHYKTIFEPFRRLHSQGDYDGTGLGLATCKKIVEHHESVLWCESEVGKGTRFFFTLPAVREAGQEETEA